MIESRIFDFENSHDCVKRAAITYVSKLSAFDVVGGRTSRLGDRQDFVGGNIDEFRKWIDKAADQPWAGDTVDLWMFASNPFGFGGTKLPTRGQECFFPAQNSRFKICGLNAGSAQ